eukprot:g1185.t1
MLAADVDRALQTLLTPNSEAFENFLSELLSPDNNRRKLAEQVLDQLKKHPDLLVQYLVSTIRRSTDEGHRIFAAVVLRKCLTLDSPVLWPLLSESVKHLVKHELLSSLPVEQMQSVLQKICDVISELASFLLVETGWPELAPTIFQLLQSHNDQMMLAGFHIIGSLALKEELDLFKDSIPQLVSCFDWVLGQGNNNVSVRTESISAYCNVVESLNESNLRNQFQPLIPKVMNSLSEFLYSGNIESAEQILESLIDLIEEAPRFLKKALAEVIPVIMEIASSESLTTDLRILAAELLVTISEKKNKGLKSLLKQIPSFAEKLFELLMLFLLDIDDVPEWHIAVDDEDEDLGNGELFDFGRESLDRVAIALGGKVLVPIAGTTLASCSTDPDWKRRHGALICLSQIAEGCADVMLKEVDRLTEICIQGLRDSVAKVRWAACHALGQLCTDLGPDLQGSNHQNIIPALIAVMGDKDNPRVQAHAAAAVVNFADDCDEEDVADYMDTLVSVCIHLLLSSSRLVIESALTALASIADRVSLQFEKYYGEVMSMLKPLFMQANEKHLQLLRAKALECISLVGAAVGKDTFRQDANEIMQLISQLHQSQFEPTDPLPSYMIQAGARMCRCLGHEFIPYLDLVMPHVIKTAGAEPDITVSNIEDEDKEDDESDDDVETIALGGKLLKIRSSAMEEKANACEMLVSYVNVLKDGFLPYLKQVTDIMVPLVKFYYNEEVREAAFQILPGLLECAIEGLNKNTGMTPDFVKQMLEFIWQSIMDAFDHEPDLELQQTCLSSIASIVDLLSPEYLTQDMVESCFEKLKKKLEENESRRTDRIQAFGDGEDDEEYENGQPPDDDEEEEELEVLDEISTVLSSFMKKFGDYVMHYIGSLMPFIQQLLEKGRLSVEHKIGICILDDILEYCPQAGNNYLHEFLPFLVSGSTNSDANIRQCSIYGLGIVAGKYPEAFQPLISALVPELVTVIQHPSAKSKENELATDNAISTLGKIMHQFPDKIDSEIVEQIWMKNLPLLHDDMEAKSMHELFINMVEQHDVRIFGVSNENLQRVVEILVGILAAGHSLSKVETAKRVYNALQSFGNTLGEEMIRTVISALTAKQQKTFHEFSTNLSRIV